MATSTPALGYFGNSTGGFGGGSGMTQIQQMVSERGSGGRGDEERGEEDRGGGRNERSLTMVSVRSGGRKES